MVKKCIVKYDDLGKPIEVVELKEFHDPQVLKSYKETCELNKKEYAKRLKAKAENEQLEKQEVSKEIKDLYYQIGLLNKVILHLLGYEELDEEEVKKLLGVN